MFDYILCKAHFSISLVVLAGCFIIRRLNHVCVIWRRIKFLTVYPSTSIAHVYIQLNVTTVQLNVKTVLFQTIKISISTQFNPIWPIDKTLLGTTTPRQCRPGSDGNEELIRIPESFTITEISSSALVTYTRRNTFFFIYLLSFVCTQLFEIKYSYLLQIICTRLYGFIYSDLIVLFLKGLFDP